MLNKLIKRILSEQIEGDKNNPLSKAEIILFKHLNKNKSNYPTQKELLNFIKETMPLFSKSPSDARLYYEMYVKNYRPEGDYENITYDDFVSFKDMKQQRTSNSSAYEYSSAKIPFKGSNLEGRWDINRLNQEYYVVESYGWYPVFLFIGNEWYGVSDSYSSSTGKQMSGSNPVRYNSGLKSKMTYVTANEMKELINGKPIDDLMGSRVETFVSDIANDILGKRKLITIGSSWGENQKKASVIFDDIKENNGKIVITINVVKAGNVVDRKMVIDPESYTEEFKEAIEKGITEAIIRTFPNFLSEDNVEFEFKHPN